MIKKNPKFLKVSLVCGGKVLCCVYTVILFETEMVLYVVSNTWVLATYSFPT